MAIDAKEYPHKVENNLWANDEYALFFYNFMLEKKRYRGIIDCTAYRGWSKKDKTAYAKGALAKIKEAMKRGEIVPPIIIDKLTKLIIDGQHRFMAACELWREGNSYILSYLEFEFENPLLSAIRYNSNSKKWSTADYVKAWILRAPSMVVGNTKKLNNFPRH